MPAIFLLIAFFAALHIDTGEACKQKMDLCFLIDGSSTVCGGNTYTTCENWKSVLNFSKQISNALDIGPEADRVAMATFFNTSEVNWNLKKYAAKTPLLSAIDGIAYHGGEYYDLPSKYKISTQIFNRQKRRQRKRFLQNVVIVITDGAPNVNKTNAEAIGAEHQKNGIAVFVVCVTAGCSEDWGKALAAKPEKAGLKTYFHVNSYSSLDNLSDEVLEQICDFMADDRYDH